jgi:hypothetical protein
MLARPAMASGAGVEEPVEHICTLLIRMTTRARKKLPLAVAHGALPAGLIANRIFYLGASLLDFKAEVAVVVRWHSP